MFMNYCNLPPSSRSGVGSIVYCAIVILHAVLSITAQAANVTLPSVFDYRIAHGKQTYTIRYQRVEFYSANCKFLLHDGKDTFDLKSYQPFDHGPSRTYFGQVAEDPSAVAFGYVRADNSVRGKIYFAEAGRGTTLEFDNGKVTHTQHVIGKLADSSFCLPPIDAPGESWAKYPTRRCEMGAEISYLNYDRLGRSVPAALEAFEFGFAPVFLTACSDLKVRPMISQLVIRTSREGCPYMTAKEADAQVMKQLPDGTTGFDSKIIREVWAKLWPEYDKKKKMVMGGSNVAAGGGNELSVRMMKNADTSLGWATQDYPFTHEFAHIFGGIHATSSFEGFTPFGGYPHTIRLGGADVMRMLPFTDARVKNGSWNGFTETKGDDVQMPPYAAFDFKRFQPDGKREVVVDVLANDYAYSQDRPRLVSVDPKSRRGRTVTMRMDAALGRHVVCVEPANERLGFDMFRYMIGDKNGFQSQGFVFLEALHPFWIYEAEDSNVAQGRFGKPERDDSIYPGGPIYVTLDDASNQASITWTVNVPRSGQYGLRFRYQLHSEAGAVASTHLSLSINGKVLVPRLPLADTRVTGWWNYVVYPNAKLQAGKNTVTLTQSGATEIEKKKQQPKAKQMRSAGECLLDYLMVFEGLDYRINFSDGKERAALDAVLDKGETFALHEESGLRYGWAKPGIGAYRVFKDRHAPDPAMLSGVTWTANSRDNFWEIEVPNGIYNVYIIAGGIKNDAEQQKIAGWKITGEGDSIGVHEVGNGRAPYVNDFLVEGVRVSNTEPDRIYSFLDCKVTVSDGRLTVKPGPSAVEPRLCYIGISQCNVSNER